MTKIMWNPDSEAGKELIELLKGGLPIIVDALDNFALVLSHSSKEDSINIRKYANNINDLYNKMMLGE